MRMIPKYIQFDPLFRVLGLASAALLVGCVTPPVVQKPQTPPTAVAAPPPPLVVPKRPPRLGLALGGGAARGFAHVGVIQALEEAGIKPDLVVGTSAGALVAALYASGKNGAALQNVAEGMDESQITDWTLPLFNRGALRGEALARYVSDQTARRPLESFPMRVGILATDLQSGEGVLFQRGDAGTAVRASSSVPTVFVPVKIGNREYVDGGLIAPVPVSQARQMGAEVVLAIDISAPPEGNATGNTVQVLLQTTAIMGKTINQYELKMADVVVRPLPGGGSGTDFSNKTKTIEAGRAAMRALIPKLRELLAANMKPIS